MTTDRQTIPGLKLMGKKVGMTRLFDEDGRQVVCTAIQIEPNVVVQVKTKENDGYCALQMGYEKRKVNNAVTMSNRVKKPLLHHYKKADVVPHKHLAESRVEEQVEVSVGTEFGVEQFLECEYVDVSGISIGKGFQGAMKLHNFSGMRATHGTGPVHRHLGSTGMRSTPGRCFKGGKRASHMGSKKKTVQNIAVFKVIEEDNVILVKGSVPGPRNGVVTLQAAKKMRGA